MDIDVAKAIYLGVLSGALFLGATCNVVADAFRQVLLTLGLLVALASFVFFMNSLNS
jgi:hypothetical protein